MCCIVHDDNDALMKQLPRINKHTHSTHKIISVKKIQYLNYIKEETIYVYLVNIFNTQI